MGNQVDKAHGGRGVALGSSTDPPPKTNKRSKKRAQPQPQRIHHSQEEQRAARSKLVQKKQINVQSELIKKEKMLHIMDAAHAVSQGQEVPEAPKSMQHRTAEISSKSPKSSANTKEKRKATESSIYMANPSSKEALAAEQRIQQKTTKRSRNVDERKNRTLDLLFGDGLKIKDDGMDYDKHDHDTHNVSNDRNNHSNTKREKRPLPINDSKAGNAALARLNQLKSNRIVNAKDRKQRTLELLHGDLLKDENEGKVAPRQTTYADDLDPDVADVHQSILNLNNCNPHEKMPPTAKLLRKVVSNVLSAETKDDQDKFGKLRLSNKKIKSAFVDMEYGVETLESLGFAKKKIYNEKEHRMDDYMVFDFMCINHKVLCHVIDLLNEYYPET